MPLDQISWDSAVTHIENRNLCERLRNDANIIKFKLTQGDVHKLIALLQVRVKLEQGKGVIFSRESFAYESVDFR